MLLIGILRPPILRVKLDTIRLLLEKVDLLKRGNHNQLSVRHVT